MKRYVRIVTLLSVLLLSFNCAAAAEKTEIAKLGEQAVATAFAKLSATPGDTGMACLTNAGYVTYRGQSTRILYDVLSEKAGISLGRGNLLPVHTRQDEALWFAFVKKKSATELLMTRVSPGEKGISATEVLNVYVDKEQSFKPFKTVLGQKAFALVTIANGWANGVPEELMNGSLFHDHLCCGVFTGYFTVNFIRKHLPLRDTERYIYIGAPAWCQDDYIMSPLNLTPGKHGYYAMDYPWYRPWKTGEKVYEKLGGIIIRFDSASQTGQAALLRFDWREDDFKQFVGLPDLKLDWKNQPWLHVWYNKFFLSRIDRPEAFVSVLKEKALKSRKDLNRLIKTGANPLKEMLGEDREWVADLN
ncbi:hypothetical protein DENIS_4330 [Desulfonema ishimotonii]|uniref:Formylmethanofuran dehydrogenase subunit E domain-containing protein n=1 Tax=Desulfonema ishimotonii TaxID=45657 RepID=A0A401G2A4_9BACT|nr:FmdE family protein [Desulfonema ishimotonii]GBC63336.1 hypothetical protein DENIS_4330 [Desulfonema ishimotonii]